MPLIRRDAPSSPAAPEQEDHRRLLTQGSPDQRWAAARAMTDAADAPVLAAALGGEADARVRGALLTSLSRSGTAESFDAMMPLLRSDEASARTGALDALRAMPEIVGARLPRLLEDEDTDVRLLACELARGLPGEQATALLAARLRLDSHPNVCAAAVEVLAEVGTAEVLPALEACAARFPEEPFLVFATQAVADRIRSQAPARRG